MMKSTTNKENAILTCPCCGGEAICTEVTFLFQMPGEVKEKIVCTICGLTMEDEYGHAKEKWNRRVTDTKVSTAQGIMQCHM